MLFHLRTIKFFIHNVLETVLKTEESKIDNYYYLSFYNFYAKKESRDSHVTNNYIRRTR